MPLVSISGPMTEHYPIGVYTIPEISAVGATEQELTHNKVPYETGIARYREIARGQILGDDSGFLNCSSIERINGSWASMPSERAPRSSSILDKPS